MKISLVIPAQRPWYYNQFNNIEVRLIPLNNTQENLNLRKNQEQINLLRMILNLLNQNNGNVIYIRIIMLIVIILLYSYLA